MDSDRGTWGLNRALLCRTLCSILTLAVLGSQDLRGAEYSFEPSVSSRLEYNDNIRLTRAPHPSVWAASLSPRLKLNYATEASELSGSGALNFRRYTRESELNATDVLLNLLGRQKFERGSLGLRADYVRDSTLASELRQTGVVQNLKQRSSLLLSPEWTYDVSERLALTLGYQYNDVSYQDGLAAGLVDYKQNAALGALRYKLSARDEATATLSYSQFDPTPVQPKVDMRTGRLSYSHLFSETMRGSIGWGLVDVERRGGIAGDIRTRRALWNGSLEYQYEAGLFALRVSRDVFPTATGTLAQVDRAALEWSRKLTETLTLGIAGAAYRTRFGGLATTGTNSNYYQFEPRLSWLATPEWLLGLGYNYQRITYRADPPDATGNAVYFTASYTWPKRDLFR
jgi:hypothetical protein